MKGCGEYIFTSGDLMIYCGKKCPWCDDIHYCRHCKKKFKKEEKKE